MRRFEIARFLIGARHALLDVGRFAYLRFEPPFGARGFEIHRRQLVPRIGQLRFERVENLLRLLARGVVDRRPERSRSFSSADAASSAAAAFSVSAFSET